MSFPTASLQRQCSAIVSDFGRRVGMEWLELDDRGRAVILAGGTRRFEITFAADLVAGPALLLSCDVCELPPETSPDLLLRLLHTYVALLSTVGFSLGVASEGRDLLLGCHLPAEGLEVEKFGVTATAMLETAGRIEASVLSPAGDPNLPEEEASDPLAQFVNRI